MSNKPTPASVGAQRNARRDAALTTRRMADTAKPLANGKPNVIRFGKGLDLWVTATQKMWRCKATIEGRRTTVNLGTYPDLSPDAALMKRLEYMRSDNPAAIRRADKAKAAAEGTTFREVAEDWIKQACRSDRPWTPLVRKAVERRLASDVYPTWGSRAVADITAKDVRTFLWQVFEGYDDKPPRPTVSLEIKRYLIAIFDLAWADDAVPYNPVKRVGIKLPTRRSVRSEKRRCVKTIEDARDILTAVEARRGIVLATNLLAHRLIALTAGRVAECLYARWTEFDLTAGTWTLEDERIKTREKHVVRLAPQAIDVIRAAKALADADGRKSEYVFPAQPRFNSAERRGIKTPEKRCSINCIMNTALRKAKLFDDKGRPVISPHGWRGTFSTVMNTLEPWSFRVIDVMLAHSAYRDSVDATASKSVAEGHYNHADHPDERFRLACKWADLLLKDAPSARELIGLADDKRARPMMPPIPDRPDTDAVVVPLRRRGAA